MKCDYCGEETGTIIGIPHPKGDIKLLCFDCIESMDDERLRAEGEHTEN
jgi:hypothetical protein